MKNVLVTGGKGQLASCIKDIAPNLKEHHFIYVDIDVLDITSASEVRAFFDTNNIDFCVNCAAYTNVDKSENEQDIAAKVNVDGVKHLAESCKDHNAKFIQISTDFVFDGKSSLPYLEEDSTKPLGSYGLTKLNGELAILDTLKEHFILRTSWLYSEYGHNFCKTMLRFAKERNVLSIVSDQVGTPTYAGDLAEVIIKIIAEDNKAYGVYHYSNEGVASWYDFAKAIFDLSDSNIELHPIRSEAYPAPAKRPSFSVMDKSKIKNSFDITIPYWRDSLVGCLRKLKSNTEEV
jgi:dTDP-4-dehydrorhamnose reductase